MVVPSDLRLLSRSERIAASLRSTSVAAVSNVNVPRFASSRKMLECTLGPAQ
jgi:hypothetical protein